MGQRFSKSDYLNGKFYQLSKELFKGKYKGLSNNERVLYSILKDRFELSIKNEWVDQDNNIYFIFEQVQLSEECCMSLKTVQRAMQTLMEFDLIDSVRQGQNLPNKLYLLKPEQEEVLENSFFQETTVEEANENSDSNNCKELLEKGTSQNDLSGQVKKSLPDKSKSPTIYTNINYTNNNYTSSSKEAVEEEENKSSNVMRIEDKIELENLLRNRKDIPEELIIKIYNILNNFFKFSRSKTVRVQDDTLPILTVREKIYSKLDMDCVWSVVDAVMNTPNKIKQLQPYVISCFYNYAEGYELMYRLKEKNSNGFNSFKQNDCDFDEIERTMLSN